MTGERLTRRSVLAALGASATGAAVVGGQTMGLLSDRESLSQVLEAGSIDLKVGWEGSVTIGGETTVLEANPDSDGDGLMDGPPFANPCMVLPDPDEIRDPLFEVEGIEPGDSGEATFALHLCGNDGYIWMTVSLLENEENDWLPSEERAGDETPELGELADRLQARAWYDPNCNDVYDEGEIEIVSGSLETVLQTLGSGYQLSPDPVRGRCIELDRVGDGEDHGKIEDEELIDSVGEVFEFTMDGETVLVELTDIEYKQDNSTKEITGAEFTVVSPEDVGLCGVDVKAWRETKTYSFPDCAESVWVDSINRTTGKSNSDYYGISHVRLFGCRDSPDCFEASNTHCIGFEWWLPEDAPLDAQTDSVAFDLGFEATQCRHNPEGDRP